MSKPIYKKTDMVIILRPIHCPNVGDQRVKNYLILPGAILNFLDTSSGLRPRMKRRDKVIFALSDTYDLAAVLRVIRFDSSKVTDYNITFVLQEPDISQDSVI